MKSYRLNGTVLELDEQTGAIVSLRHPGCGEIMKNGGGLVDLSWPVHLDYEALRADPCGKYFQKAPTIEGDDRSVTLTWDGLPQNTATPELPALAGRIWARVTLTACEDGRSIALRCRVKNRSATPVAQILFPDLRGLQPIAGEEHTRFTTMMFHSLPFVEQRSTPETRERFYGENVTVAGQFYKPAGMFPVESDKAMCGRWFDFGGLSGGLSLYRCQWGWGPENPNTMGANDTCWVKLDHESRSLRIANLVYLDLKQGEEYDSGDYVLTPHAGGWVQGAAPYRDWVRAHQKRAVPVPRAMKEKFGFRTVWMCTGYPKDPDDITWRYTDIPKIAADMAEHGIYSLNLWGSFDSDGHFPVNEKSWWKELGGFDGYVQSVKRANDMGVEVYPLVSWVQIWKRGCERQGLTPNASWAETLKAVPVFRAPYMQAWSSYDFRDFSQPWWYQGVLDSLRFLRDHALSPNVCWDQYLLADHDDTLHDLFKEYREETYPLYPDAHFSGESTFFFESEMDICDSTWDWMWWKPHDDWRPMRYLAESMRPNMNVDSSTRHLKYIFMDDLMANIYPSRPGQLNGSALIADYPGFSATLKDLTALRRAYLPYFADGEMLGDCVLSEDCAQARVTGYRYAGSAAVFAVKEDDGDAVLKCDLTPFIGKKAVRVTVRDQKNRELFAFDGDAVCSVTLTGEKETLFVIEFTPGSV